VGRTAELVMLDRLLAGTSRHRVLGIYGPSGIGKTQVVQKMILRAPCATPARRRNPRPSPMRWRNAYVTSLADQAEYARLRSKVLPRHSRKPNHLSCRSGRLWTTPAAIGEGGWIPFRPGSGRAGPGLRALSRRSG
jgi:hypothetical protein